MKSVKIFASFSGATAKTVIAPIYVDTKIKVDDGIYKIPKGYRLRVFEIDFEADGETRLFIEVSFDAGATWRDDKTVKLASKGHIARTYRFPHLIEAVESDYHVRLSYVQPTALAGNISLHGELAKLEE